jgi:Ca2+-binding EF-hand superfamily protein
MAGTMRKGNWFEEAALLKYTGVKNIDPRDPKAGTYTYGRCIEHTDRLNPKDYESVMASCIKDPKSHPAAKTLKDKVGPRFALLEARLKAEVDASVTATVNQAAVTRRRVEYASENSSNFNNPNFQASLREGVDPARTPTYSANYVTDQPITFYSESVNNGKDIPFPTTFSVASNNPFKKCSAFSTKAEMNPSAFKSESNERPRPFPTVLEYSHVKSFRLRLIKHVARLAGATLGSGQVIQRIVEMFWGLVASASPVPQIQMEALQGLLSLDLGFNLTNDERRSILYTFNEDGTGSLSLPELTDCLRGALNPRAGELVDKVIASLYPNEDGMISSADIRSAYKGVDELSVNKGGDTTSVDDLYEYFTDCSAELDSAYDFEAMIQLWM